MELTVRATCAIFLHGKECKYSERLEQTLMHMPEKGIYRHFKGNRYELIDIARHSETGEWMVVYRALYGEHGLWVRPLSMWE